MIKCYHARRIELVVDSEPKLFYDGPMHYPLIAIIDSDNEKLEDIWDCCNNSCWWDRKYFRCMKKYKQTFRVRFTRYYSGYCNDDLIVEMNGMYYVALTCGWKEFTSLKDAMQYCEDNSYWCRISFRNNQHPTGKEHTLDELKQLKRQYNKQGIKSYIIRDAK